MTTLRLALALLAIGMLAVSASTVHADGAWLDRQPLVQWNGPRMAIPIAPPLDTANVSLPCLDDHRPPETDEDEELVRAGWRLIGSYTGGWGMLVIRATSDYDGMCRPNGYQYFVFQDGLFAGTVSPELMYSRIDGSAGEDTITTAGELSVNFLRYAASDALCCPSRTTTANYRIDRTSGWPVLTLASVFTSPNP